MKTTSVLPKRFLTRRDKNGHHRSRSSDGGQKHRPLTSDAFFALFKPNDTKQQREEQIQGEERRKQQEIEDAKIEEVHQKLEALDIHGLRDDHIRYALGLKSGYMDVDKAVDMIRLQKTSLAGKILPYNPSVHMLGAENKGNVTCYLDALLFAMFAKIDAFECILKVDASDEARNKLAALLRLWVNMLRSGKLIETEMTSQIQDALAACGWRDAQLTEQQDTSEAFAFITETLQLPLLALSMDLFHHGKNDDADHRVVYERLLNLAIPTDTDGKEVKLEDCLEEYFNAKVDVLRDSLDDKTPLTQSESVSTPKASAAPETPKSTIRIVNENGNEEDLRSPESMDPEDEDLQTPEAPPVQAQVSASSSNPMPRPLRARTDSIIQRVVIDEDAHTESTEASTDRDSETASLSQKAKRAKRSASIVKAITIPAWQFFRLIPWHSSANGQPKSDQEVAWHFDQRPVVGICLKRYMMDKDGTMKRQNTYIDIPEQLKLPRFIIDDRHVEEGGLAADYKLVLQSVVCHRGDSLHAGHYISFSRVAPKLLTDNRRHESDPPPDYEEPQWAKFDDLANERVSMVDDFKQSLKEEMPYLLFYQIIPTVEVEASVDGENEAGPPAYDEAAPQPIMAEDMISSKASSYFENAVITSAAPSVRFSAELERPTRRSFAEEDGYLSVSRRDSAAYSDDVAVSPGLASYDHSPGVSPGEETTAQRLSRAAAKLRSGTKSRPQSQAGEHRLSSTMSRLGLLKSSKEPLVDSPFDDSLEIVGHVDNDVLLDERDASSHLNGKAKGKDKENHRRSKSKSNKSSPEKLKEPDRECVVQ
ncbi:cysteine proteinase [Xylariaceae sp. FL0255]|nr:cysteine proteinase [Xylariaceae sp. FL0255]